MFLARPKGITIIGIFDIIQGPIAMLEGIRSNDFIYAILYFVLGITTIWVGIGLLKGKIFAWKLAVILSFIGIGIGLIPLLFGNVLIIWILGISQIIIDIAVLIYLFRPHVKGYFTKNVPSVT